MQGSIKETISPWTLVPWLFAIGAVVLVVAVGDIVLFVLRLDQTTRLVKPSWTVKLLLQSLLLAASATFLSVAAWRIWRSHSVHRAVVTSWSSWWTLFWAFLSLLLLLVYYPIPPHPHHLDRVLLVSGSLFVWSGWFLLRPGTLQNVLNTKPYQWLKVCLVNLLVFVVIGEGLCRLTDPLLARSGMYGNASTPSGLKPQGGANSLGFRDRERGIDRRNSSARIVALGDSFTYGVGVSYDDTFVTLVERALQPKQAGLEVINLGVPGWDPEHEVRLLENYGIHLRPDLVMLNLFVGNDIIRSRDAGIEESFTVAGQIYFVHWNGNWVHDHLGPDRWYLYHNLNYLMTIGSRDLKLLVERAKTKLSAHAVEARAGDPVANGRSEVLHELYLKSIDDRSELFLKEDTFLFNYHWSRTLSTLTKLHQFLSARHVPWVLVLLPDQVQVEDELQREFVFYTKTLAGSYSFDKPQRLLRAWCAEQGIEVIDLLPLFRQDQTRGRYYRLDDIHWNVEGHALAARTILPIVQKWIDHPDKASPGN